ncbi:MAG TPA: hypothetical protein PLI30_04340 [Petrimonas sp.]|jgi:hypothetical protein|nr:hypothetical protein [Petrimonas sp.]
MEDYLDRINKIVELENITVSKLESIIGASKNVLHKPMKNKTDIQTKWLIKISENFPQYSLDWLLIGRGEMYRNQSEDSSMAEDPVNGFKIAIKEDRLLKIIESQQRTIENLSKGGGENAGSA